MKKIFKFSNPFYDFFLERKSISEINFIPENLWTGDSENGRKIIDGSLQFNNETIVFRPNSWRSNNGSKVWNEKLHSFEWVNDVRTVGTNKARIFIRDCFREWQKKYNKYNVDFWKMNILCKRVCSLLENSSFFFSTADQNFQKIFSRSLNKQAFFLIKNYKEQVENNNKIFLSKSIILSSLCFKNLRYKLSFGMEMLFDTIERDLLDDSMHASRSPNQHFEFLKSLIDIKNFLGFCDLEIPKYLNVIISKMGTVLKFFKINNSELAIFNESRFVGSIELNEVIKRSNSRVKIPSELKSSCYNRVSENRLTFIMDNGSPSLINTHASSLSFEFSYVGEKIVVNSGSPYVNDKKWSDAMRSTAAFSTVSIDNHNSSDIYSNKRIAKVWYEKIQNNRSFWINSAHSGYKEIFGIIHNRKVHIDSEKLIIRGQDYFSKPVKHYNLLPKVFFVRFHIHPDIKLNATESKRKVFLKLKNNLAWEFICSEPKIKLGEGIYLGSNKIIQKNNHILISGNVIPGKKINWAFRLMR